MAGDDEDIRVRVLTALNCGERPSDVARRFGVPVRTVTALSKARHRLPEPKLPEGSGKILHTVAVPEKWCERPERADDAARRAAARQAIDDTLAKYGLKRVIAPIILPDTAAKTHGAWRRRKLKASKP